MANAVNRLVHEQNVGEWAAWSPASWPASYVSAVTGYPKLSHLELQLLWVSRSLASDALAPSPTEKGVVVPKVLGRRSASGLTYLLMGFGLLRAVDWKSPSVPGHLGPRGSSQHASEWMNQGKRQGDKPARQKSWCPETWPAYLVTRLGHTRKGIGQECEVPQAGGPLYFLVTFGKWVTLLLVYMLNI